MSPPTRAALRLAIAQTVRDLRLRRGLTVQQLAARADLDVDDLLALEAGRPSRAGDDLIAHYLQLRRAAADCGGRGGGDGYAADRSKSPARETADVPSSGVRSAQVVVHATAHPLLRTHSRPATLAA